MANLSELIKNLSLKTVIVINIFLAILILIPLTIILSTRQTKTSGKASINQIIISTPAPTEVPTLVPTLVQTTPLPPAEITLVDRFYGKVGDSVVIYGQNFGNQKETVFFNGTQAFEIKSWTKDRIHVLVPEGASNGPIRIREAVSPYNFIVYDKDIFCEVLFSRENKENMDLFKKEDDKKTLGLKNCPLIARARFVFQGNEGDFDLVVSPLPPLTITSILIRKKLIEKEVLNEIEINPQERLTGEKLLTIGFPQDKKINLVAAELWENNNLVSFFVNPVDLSD